MNLLCWNCLGLGNPKTVRFLRRWSSVNNVCLLFVSKTMIDGDEAAGLKSRIGFDSSFSVRSVGELRRVVCFGRQMLPIFLWFPF